MKMSTKNPKSWLNSTATSLSRIELLIVFLLFAISRMVSARYNNINDCDETYNYWEPAHYLMYGNGFQTWEYSPKYAIRSYFYLWIYTIPGLILKYLGQFDKVVIFYSIRTYLALTNSAIETFLFGTISRNFNIRIAVIYGLISIYSPGMFNSTTAFLPSSFGQSMICLAIGFWFSDHYRRFIFFTAFSTLVGWPFTAAICLPMALKIFFKRRFMFQFIFWSIAFGLIISAITISVDSYYYGKLVFANFNIVLYNIFSPHGPELYGTEPLSYYLNNLILNFNFVFILSLISIIPFLASFILFGKNGPTTGRLFYQKQALSIAALYLWFGIFFLQAHKEERFIYPAYPLISLCAAFSLNNFIEISDFILPKWKKISRTFISITLLLYVLLSISRILALYRGYGASIQIFENLNQNKIASSNRSEQTVLCLGKEWHRFPSNFFISNNIRVEFISSEFKGQLPQHYAENKEHATRIIPSTMNDQNKEETSAYVPLSKCDLIIDSDYPDYYGRDLPYSRQKDDWVVLYGLPFLDSSRSSSLFRSFYVPILSDLRCKFVNYNLLARKSDSNKNPK